MNPYHSSRPNPGRALGRFRWLALILAAAATIVGAEYLLNAVLNPTVDWSPSGVLAHMLLDLGLMLPLVALAIAGGRRLANRLGMSGGDVAALLGKVGAVVIVFLLLALPVAGSRDLAHEWFGTTYGFSLAEMQTTVVTSDLTVQESTQLCSFGAVRSPALARDGSLFSAALVERLRVALQDTLIQLSILLPLLLAGVLRRSWSTVVSSSPAPVVALGRSLARPVRISAIVAATALLVFFGSGFGGQSGDGVAEALPIGEAFNACTDGGPVKRYDVSAIDVTITLNRWGDHVVGGNMYALDANVSDIRSFEAALESDRTLPDSLGVTRVSHGLRKDLIQPLVLRANLGDCLEISFTNDLGDGDPASMHILGLPHTVDNAGSAVGYNPDTMADPGESILYQIPIPLTRNAERAYYFHDHGAGRRRQNMGMFGAIVVEPRGAVYLDPETGEELDTATGSNWEAIIIDPDLDGQADAKSFREFVLLYHEIGDEAFTDIRDRDGKKMPLVDELAGVYRPGARAINYRSEPFRNRIAQDEETNGALAGHGKSLGYSSYPFGDPATPIPRSYVGEATKTRLLHGGSEVFHVHHLHGGGDRWRRNPNADPNNDFWKGLTKVPPQQTTSIRLDSQSIGPGSSYNLEHECGAGGCQQGVGDFLFHCHIGHHYISGMWSFWRVFGTEQTAETNLYGNPLAVVPDLFQADNPFSDVEAPSNTPPDLAVSAGELIGLTVDGGKMIVANSDFTDPQSQVRISDWIRFQLPPRGERLDSGDATVWNWTHTGALGADLRIWGEPESLEAFPGYVSEIPGQRPEVLFNPKNGRYTWPLFRPQVAQRPPFSARHSGAPWLGEDMREGRMDGLCAQNGVHPAVDVGDAVRRYYPVSAISIPLQVTPDSMDQDGKIFVLNEEEAAIRSGQKAAEPLAIRSNVGDCVEIIFTNKVPDEKAEKNFSKGNIHSHFVQFDTQASDGVITGFSYEQSVRPVQTEDRKLTVGAAAGSTLLSVDHTDRLRKGIWLGIGLGEGVCGTSPTGRPLPCTEVRRIKSLPDPQTIELDRPLRNNHSAGEPVGVEFVRYRWYSDVDFGTVFFHTHVDFKDWDHGLFGAHIVEPKGSTYHNPRTGAEVRAGTLVDVRVDPSAGGNPVAAGVEGSFREFMLFLQNNNPAEGQFTQGGGTINLRAEPWRLRDGDDAYRFSSVTHDDPFTQNVRAYVGDPVVIRGLGVVERVGGIRVTGHRFNQERHIDQSDTRDATFIGISERFDVSLEGGAGGTRGYPGDYLYYSTLGRDFESGAWGLLRVFDSAQSDLQMLPDQSPPNGNSGFPELSFTGAPPPSLDDGPGDACPMGAPVREYAIAATDASIIYNELAVPDSNGVAYQLQSDVTSDVRTPLVMRVNEGECLRVHLRNDRSQNSSISIGELPADPQRSYGAAIGLNYDSTVAPGDERTYEYFADRELGVVVALNLADIDSAKRGGYAGVVVEPDGATYLRPGTSESLPEGGVGVQADIQTPDGVITREFVALFSDEDKRIGHNTMPYNVGIEGFAGINYAAEDLALRGMVSAPADVFRSDLWGDPRYVVDVPAGTPLTFRVAQPWGDQLHLPTLEGHRWAQEWRSTGSEQVFNDVLAPGMSLDLKFVGGAGGDIAAPGDYLFLDRRQPFLEDGLWAMLRVTEPGLAPVADRVTITKATSFFEGGQQWLTIEGVNGLRPAGDTARRVAIYAGPETDGRCQGPIIGRANVDGGNGRWSLSRAVPRIPSELCVRSLGGGVASIIP